MSRRWPRAAVRPNQARGLGFGEMIMAADLRTGTVGRIGDIRVMAVAIRVQGDVPAAPEHFAGDHLRALGGPLVRRRRAPDARRWR